MFLRGLAPDQYSKNACLNPAAHNWAEIHADVKVHTASHCNPAGLCACSTVHFGGSDWSPVVADSYCKADNLNTFFSEEYLFLC